MPSEEAPNQKPGHSPAPNPMKHIFTKQNMSTFIVAALATTAAALFIIPLVRKFIPKASSTTTTTPAA